MAEQVRIPFTFHVKSARLASAEQLERTRQESGLRVGLHDQHLPVGAELHPSPELDRLTRQLHRQGRAEKVKAVHRAQLRHALANSAMWPRDVPPDLSAPARALYQNILQPRQNSSPAESVSSDDMTEANTASVGSRPARRRVGSLYGNIRRPRQAALATAGSDPIGDTPQQDTATPGNETGAGVSTAALAASPQTTGAA